MHQWKVQSGVPAIVLVRSTRPNIFAAKVLHIRAGETPEEIPATVSLGVTRAELDVNRVNAILGPGILAISTMHTLGLSTVDLGWGWRYRIDQDGAPSPVAISPDGDSLPVDSDGFVLGGQGQFATPFKPDGHPINFIPHGGGVL